MRSYIRGIGRIWEDMGEYGKIGGLLRGKEGKRREREGKGGKGGEGGKGRITHHTISNHKPIP